ncbi:hypothetical protein GCM10022206_10350 [Streptomyces chiangmaiensis]
MAALGVGQLYLVPDLEGPATAGGTGRFGHVTSLPVAGEAADHARVVRGPGDRAAKGCAGKGLSWAGPWL